MSSASLDGLGPGSDWILANIDQQGYFRVNYDEDNWRKLISQLNTDHRVSALWNTMLTNKSHTNKHVDILYKLQLVSYIYRLL